MDPREARSALVEEIEYGLTAVASGHPVDQLSQTLDQLSACFQAFGICILLADGDTGRYRDNLVRSGFARRYFLKKSVDAGNLADRYLALSRNDAFFDALAGGHGALAREIATLSGDQFHEGWEYPEDFQYFLFLHRLVIDPDSLGGPACMALLESYEVAADGSPPGRAKVLRALAERNQPAFAEGLSLYMSERDEELQERNARLSDPDLTAFLHWPRTFVSVEGLALIAMGRAFGIQGPDDIPLCPTIARLSLTPPATDDPFEEIEAALRRERA